MNNVTIITCVMLVSFFIFLNTLILSIYSFSETASNATEKMNTITFMKAFFTTTIVILINLLFMEHGWWAMGSFGNSNKITISRNQQYILITATVVSGLVVLASARMLYIINNAAALH